MKVLQREDEMNNDFPAVKKIRDLLISFFKTIAIGVLAGLFARYAVFPVMGVLHNRWITIISAETVDLVYFWIGQVVGTVVFIISMFIDLRGRTWSKFSSILAVIISIVFLFIVGIMLSNI